jgi:hypothetical protein
MSFDTPAGTRGGRVPRPSGRVSEWLGRWIELPQRTLRVTPEQLEGARREECWKRVVQAQPRYANYQEKTDRQLPVIRLVPAGAQP